MWHNIATIKKDLKRRDLEIGDVFELQLRSGDNTQFWYDKWTDGDQLKNKYPDLFNLETRKRCNVADRIIDGCFVGHWNSCPVEFGLSEDLDNLTNELSTVNLASGCD
ncbi:unnamed protein product [Lactuca virosa]|uniref:Uncharacterized protein n=1 Tax=Lactuca virosa TaxID=75947 RepID=A0AAU9L9C3_9ASTR|nr:unnamed protein product [Lactuca virosa]